MPAKFDQTDEPVHEFAERAMIRYGTEVVENRAVPDYRDGLKPVQRAILWAMYQFGLHHTSPYKKSARTVGEVIGSYHPHSDSSSYDAMVKMANYATPLVDGYGNWGTNVDSAASMRYCFVSGTRIMTEFGLIPIEEMSELSDTDRGEELPIHVQVASLEPASIATKWIHSGTHDTVRLKTKLGYEVQCTPNQPFYTFNRVDYVFEWKTASNLSESDVLCLGCPEFASNVVGNLDPSTAFYLGLLTKASLNESRTLYFAESYASRFDTFRKKTAEFLKISEDQIQVKSKDDKQSFLLQLTTEHADLFDQVLDVSSWNEYTSHVPEPVFRASRASVCGFLKAVFMQYRRIKDNVLNLNMRSKQLLLDTKTLLLSYLHVPTGPISEEMGWYSMEVLDTEKVVNLGFIKPNKLVPRQYVQKLDGFEDWMNAQILYSVEQGKPLEYTSILRSLSDTVSVLRRQLCSHVSSNYSEEHAILKLRRIVNHDFLLDHVDTVVPGRKHHVYDLTVPKTNAFVASGFMSHNTEARLSKFSDLVLLDRDYLAVTDMIPNYSEDKMMPLVLPSKLPTALIIGNISIAVGIAASSPPFKVEGVTKLVTRILEGKPVTEKECAKYLEFDYRYGGECISSVKEIESLCASGKGSLQFAPAYSYDARRKELSITSACPGLISQTSFDTLFRNIAQIDGVKSIDDRSDKKIEICHTITFGRVQDQKIKAAVAKIEQLLIRSERYDIGVLDKSVSDTKFGRESVVSLLHKWVKWRIQLEQKVLSYKKDLRNQELERFKLLLFTIDNLSVIIRALEQRDSEAWLVKCLKISYEQAQAIMDLKLRQVKKLERPRVIEMISAKKQEILELSRLQKAPEKSVMADLSGLTTKLKAK